MLSKSKIQTNWTSNLAYVVGLITTDGSLSKDGRHIDISSKEIEQLENIKKCLGITTPIGKKLSGSGHVTLRIQISSVSFYKFLSSVGLTPAKTKTIADLTIPKKYFFDFLRGHFDGDGSFYSYMDLRWKSSFMFYLSLVSASRAHIDWLREKIFFYTGARGHITSTKNNTLYQLKFAKFESKVLIEKMYYSSDVVCLSRKYEKILSALQIYSK